MQTDTDPTPIELFQGDPTKRDRLYAIMHDPVFDEAIALAEDMMKPKVGGATDGNQALTIARFHQSAGATEFVNKLRTLTRKAVERKPLKVRGLAKSPDDLPKEP